MVHGDLRNENVLLGNSKFNDSTAQSEKEAQVWIIDFDWAGTQGEARYPSELNQSITWHEDVVDLGPIEMHHDLHFHNLRYAHLSKEVDNMISNLSLIQSSK